MKTSNAIIITAILLLIFSLIAYDFLLKREYKKNNLSKSNTLELIK